MKYWLSHLPLEAWVDVYRYPWISREELGRIVDRFRNRKYVEYLQFYLHDWGKQKLNYLHFHKLGFHKFNGFDRLYLDFPQTPMPGNIKSFEWISIYHFDAQTLNFLHQIQPILSDVNLDLFFSNKRKLRTICANLLPLLDGIHSLACETIALPTVQQCFGGKLSQIDALKTISGKDDRMNDAAMQATANVLLNWLTSPVQNGSGPKLCKALSFSNVLFEKIILAIREEFLAAKTPSTFAVIFSLDTDRNSALEQFAGFHLQNGSGEQLHGVKKHGYIYFQIQITRHPADCGKEMQEWIGRGDAMKHRNRIGIINPTMPFSFCSLM